MTVRRVPTAVDLFTAFGRSKMAWPLHRPIGLLMPYILGIMNKKMMCGMIGLAGRRVAALSCGAPATKLSNTTVKQNLQDGYVMFKTIEKAVVSWQMDGDFTFSDLSVEPEACGCTIEMPENSLPYVTSHPVQSPDDLRSLRIPDPYKDGRMPVFVECVKHLARRFSLLTITGGSGPFTLAGELMGNENAALATIKRPAFLEELLEYCLEVNLRYMRALIKAGAEAILIGEPTGAILSPSSFRRFSGNYIKRLVRELNRPVILHVCGNAAHLIEEMCATGVNLISLDSPVNLRKIADRVPSDIIIAGNLDPVAVLLEMNTEEVKARTKEMLAAMREFPNYVAASGCDLSPQTPQENIKAFIDTVKSFR